MAAPLAHHIIRLSETGSTNKDAMRLALQGEPLPLWVAATRQTEGRGRAGRAWVSVPGNLHASVAFRTGAAPELAGQLALVAGLMLYEATGSLTGLCQQGLRLKWPNDLMIGAAKTGGILVESTLLPREHALISVIGFGLNIVSAPDLDRPVTSLAAHGEAADSDSLLAALADNLQTWLDIWDEGRGFAVIRSEWLERGGPFGEPLTITAGAERVSGTYQGLSDGGALLVRTGLGLETFNFGDVALGPVAGAPGDK